MLRIPTAGLFGIKCSAPFSWWSFAIACLRRPAAFSFNLKNKSGLCQKKKASLTSSPEFVKSFLFFAFKLFLYAQKLFISASRNDPDCNRDGFRLTPHGHDSLFALEIGWTWVSFMCDAEEQMRHLLCVSNREKLLVLCVFRTGLCNVECFVCSKVQLDETGRRKWEMNPLRFPCHYFFFSPLI